jgi:O-antigen/teichoic acid export membrane protein
LASPRQITEYLEARTPKQNLQHAAVSGAVAMVGSKATVYLIQLTGMIVLSRLLGPGDVGLVATVNVVTAILVEFGMLRMGDAVIQTSVLTQRQMSTLFWINQVLCAVLFIGVASAGPLLAWFYGDVRITQITVALSGSFLFFGLSAQHLALLQRKMEFGKLAMANLIAVSVSDVLAITLAYRQWGYWAIVVRTVTPPVVLAGMSWLLCPWRPGMPGRLTEVRELVLFGLHSLGNYTMSYATRSLDKVLVARLFGVVALGNYSRAYNFYSMPVSILSDSVSTLAVSTLTRLRGDRARYEKYFLQALNLSAFVGMGAGAVLTVVGCDILLILLGAKWDVAARLFYYFAPGIGPGAICGAAGWLFLSSGRADRFFLWGALTSIVTCLLMIFGSLLSPAAVAIAYSGSFALLAVPGLAFAGAEMKIGARQILAAVWAPTIGAITSIPISWFMTSMATWAPLGSGSVMTAVAGAIISAAVYTVLAVSLARSLAPLRLPWYWLTTLAARRAMPVRAV